MTFDRTLLATQVERLRAKLDRIRGAKMNEENTKNALIAPLVRALGWDDGDPDEVHCEYRLKSNDTPVDYALMLQREPVLLIEAKPLDHDIGERRSTNQLISYSTQAGVQWVLLTNGVDFHIYNSTAKVPLDGKLFRKLSLAQTPVEEFVCVLGLLSKGEMAQKRIDRAWDSDHVDRQVKALLTDTLCASRPSPRVVNVLAKESKGKLTPALLTASLRRAKITIDFPPGPSEENERARARGRKPTRAAKPRTPSSDGSKRSGAPRAALAALIAAGRLKPSTQLTCTYRGHDLMATIEADGSVSFKGKRFDSPSGAAAAARAPFYRGSLSDARGPATNGWAFWRLRNGEGDSVTLDAFARSRA